MEERKHENGDGMYLVNLSPLPKEYDMSVIKTERATGGMATKPAKYGSVWNELVRIPAYLFSS